MDFDFDAWAKLAKEDPAGFERQREATLRATIAAAPSEFRQRLEGLQFRLDLERRRATSPLGSAVRMNSLMWAGFYRLRKELNGAAHGAKGLQAGPPRSAEIIPMRTAGGGRRNEQHREN